MFHASGNLPFFGSKNNLFIRTSEIQYELGIYDQCISSGSQTTQIKGQYCLVFIKGETLQQPYNFDMFKVNKKSETGLDLKVPRKYEAKRPRNWVFPGYSADLIVGLCVPSSCQAEDVRNAVAEVIGKNTYFVKERDRSYVYVQHHTMIYSLVTSNNAHLCFTESKILDASSYDEFAITFKY